MKHAGIVHLQLGKAGITQGVIDELNTKLENTDPVVVKMNQGFRESNDRKEAAATLAEQTNSRQQSLVGGTLILTRKH